MQLESKYYNVEIVYFSMYLTSNITFICQNSQNNFCNKCYGSIQIFWLRANQYFGRICFKRFLFMILLIQEFVFDLIDSGSKIMSHEWFVKQYGNLCSLQMFNKLIAAIPQKWKRAIHNEVFKEYMATYEKFDMAWK